MTKVAVPRLGANGRPAASQDTSKRAAKLEQLRQKVTKLVEPPIADTPTTTIMDITPDAAIGLLERHAPNRNIRDGRVQQFARDMLAGAWRLNGETVKFDKHGKLMDGQHRLWGVVESKVTIRTYVAYGLEPDTILTVDTGAPRTLADQLHLLGKPNSSLLGAVGRLWFRYDHGILGADNRPISTHEALMMLEEHPTIAEAASIVAASKRGPGFLTPLTFTLSGALAVDRTKALQWLEAVRAGTGLDARNAAWVLREKLLAQRASRAKLRPLDILALCIKSWNAFAANRPVQVLAWQYAREPFPKFVSR